MIRSSSNRDRLSNRKSDPGRRTKSRPFDVRHHRLSPSCEPLESRTLLSREFHVADGIVNSMTEEPDPNFFTRARDSALKPTDWIFLNPHPDSGSTWRTNISNLSLPQLLEYNLVFMSNHATTNFSNADRDKLQAWVSAGGTLWIDDCGGMLVNNFFVPFNYASYDGWPGSGAKVSAQPSHPFFNSVYSLTTSQISILGSPGYSGHEVGYDTTKWIDLLDNTSGSNKAPDMLLMYYGQGRLIVTADDWGCAVDDNAEPESLKVVYNVLNWAQDQLPPTAQITSPAADMAPVRSATTITWTSTDDYTSTSDMRFSWRLDGGSWSSFDKVTSCSLTGLSQGAHTIEVQAMDLAGNVSLTPASRTFYADLTVPAVTATVPSGTVSPPVSTADITFSEPILVSSLGADDFVLTAPGGATIPVGTPALVSGNTYRVTFPTQTALGTYSLAVGPNVLDLAGNPMAAAATSSFTLALPDLTVTSVSPPTPITPGQSVTGTWQVKNIGTLAIPSGASWTDQVYISALPTFNLATATLIGSATQSGPLAVNASYSGSLSFVVPSGLVGTGYVFVVTDAGQTISESNEGNNTSAPVTVTATYPDLTIAATVPSYFAPGIARNVSWTVTNGGVVPAVADWEDRVYLSTNSTLDAGDVLVATEPIVSQTPLAAAGSYTINRTVTLPANTAAGSYYLLFVADGGNAQPETNESNNLVAKAITVDATAPTLLNLGFVGTTTTTTTLRVTWMDANGMDVASVTNPANYQVVGSGGDRLFGNGNDVTATIAAITYQAFDSQRGQATITFNGSMPEDLYQVQIRNAPGVTDTAGNPFAGGTYAATLDLQDRVLMVNVHGGSYDGDGYDIYQTLLTAGAQATYINLSLNGQVANELNAHPANYYDQVWVFDLSSYTDAPLYPADWQAIANWYNADPSQQIIADARMISSYWSGRWQNEGRNLTQNYYENLKSNGGGLVLGTDHSEFISGINEINSKIGLNPFFGDFSLSTIPVDTGNALMTFPNNMGTQLLDDSSPGQAPYGLQPNGRILYSLAWHSGNVNTPGISSTIKGLVGFHIDVTSPASGSQFYQGQPVTLAVQQHGGTGPFTYTWTSNLDGELGTGSTLVVSNLNRASTSSTSSGPRRAMRRTTPR